MLPTACTCLSLKVALLLADDGAQETSFGGGKARAPDLDPERTSASMLLLLGALGIVLLLALVIVVAVLRRPKDDISSLT